MSRSNLKRLIKLEKEKIKKEITFRATEDRNEPKCRESRCEDGKYVVRECIKNDITLTEKQVDVSEIGDANVEVEECTESSNDVTIAQKLLIWYEEHHPTRKCVEGLMKILVDEKLNVPKSLSGLLKRQPERTYFRTVSPGKYYHLGLQKQIEKIPVCLIETINKIEIDIGIDGLPLFKSSQMNAWPILGKIVNLNQTGVFLIGCYIGNKKPHNVDCFLHDFIYEAKHLKENGIFMNGRLIYVEIRAFICDSPARAFICDIVGHNSLNGCIKCYQKGIRIEHVTVYSSYISQLRTDDDFKQRTQKGFHKQNSMNGPTGLEELGIGMISQFPLEPMHLIDLGVTKKMVSYLLDNQSMAKLTTEQANTISRRLVELAPYIPKEFQRKPRGLEEFSRWKATEFRQFILYYGILVLKDVANDDFYYEFLILHIAYRLLSTPKHYGSNIATAEELLNLFVNNFSSIFGKTSTVFNVHSLLHLPQCARTFGVMPNFSAYCFENFLQELKKRVRNGSKILEQIRNSYSNRKITINSQRKKFIKSRNSDILAIETENFYLSKNRPNNFCCIHPYIPIKITGFSEGSIRGVRVQNLKQFYESPVDSSSIGIHIGSIVDETEETFSIEQVYCKLVAFPYGDLSLLVPILHTCL
ncbi:uncharacterized protein LOC142240153 [Haematobia irritans]|uniref:uncharacterized protein LOC142240153 n=1 Tax=Haematobia irritans TaxID=7368 RepID=UPI003F50C614